MKLKTPLVRTSLIKNHPIRSHLLKHNFTQTPILMFSVTVIKEARDTRGKCF